MTVPYVETTGEPMLDTVKVGDVVPVESAGTDLSKVYRHISAPDLPPPTVPSGDASLCRIADTLEINVHDSRAYKSNMETQAMELVEHIRFLTYMLGASLVVQGLLLFVAAFR